MGGVSFEAVAQPDPSLSGRTIELSYVGSRPDGSRLVVRAGGTVLRINVPDWQLVPTVQFAASEYHAVVSLFGEGPDQKNYYYLQYHDAMKDTLMGMRMLQADILFISLAQHWRTPSYGGRVLLGAGEQASQENTSMEAARRLDATLRQGKWRSWVLTDAGTTPTFGNVNGELVVRASPYYYFWNVNQQQSEAALAANNRLVDEHNALLATVKAKIATFNSLVNSYNASRDTSQRNSLKTQMNQLEAETNRGEAELKSLRSRIKSGGAEPTVFEVTSLTSAMRSQESTLAAYNPSVYRAYQRLAQFAALFRYVKNNNPSNWNTFKQSLTLVSVQPWIKTPTAWERAGSQR